MAIWLFVIACFLAAVGVFASANSRGVDPHGGGIAGLWAAIVAFVLAAFFGLAGVIAWLW